MNQSFVRWVALSVFLLSALSVAHAQEPATPFYFGVDLSYVNEMEDCGAVYRENGQPHDPFNLFAEHGATLVRARLWHDPDWTTYSTLEDVKRTFRRARDEGMATLLDIHYSDTWADAGTQGIPAAWQEMDDAQLAVAVYQYTSDVLHALAADDLTPAFVQVGNETNSGLLRRPDQQDFNRDAPLFNAGIRAVRDFAAESGIHPQVVLHVAQPENTTWWFTQAEAAGITDFDVIGLSFYPQWSTFSIADMGAQVSFLRQRFGKQVMVLEAGYPWTRDAVDETAGNVLNKGLRGYPFSPEGQYRFMTDMTQTLISNGASGVVYWEPGWVSTPCLTRWGQGSHWENATFFDFQHDNEVLEGINFLKDTYLHPASFPDGVVEAAYGIPLVEDSLDDVLNGRSSLDLESLYVQSDDSQVSLALVVAGDVLADRGSYLIYIDTTGDTQGADVDVGQRPVTVADPYKPEFRLDVSIKAQDDTGRGSYLLNQWVNGVWEPIAFTGGAALSSAEQSVIELQLPRAVLGNPRMLNLAVISTDRGRVHTASDILGTDAVLADQDAPLVLDRFTHYDFAD